MVSGLTFRSFIRFEFIFACGVRRCSGFIVFHGAVQLSRHQGPGGRGCVCAGCLCQWGAPGR